MNIKLELITSTNVFIKNPQLTNIWEEPFNTIMQEAYLEDIENQKKYVNLEFGDFFYIKKDDLIIGLTGYFVLDDQENIVPYNENTKNIYLRWHGVIPEERGNGYSTVAFELLIEKALEKFPNLENIIELVPQNSYGKNVISKHFEKIGFIKNGDIERYEWANCEWQPYHLNVPNFFNKKLSKPKLKF